MKQISFFIIVFILFSCANVQNRNEVSTIIVNDETEAIPTAKTEIAQEAIVKDTYDVPVSSDYFYENELEKQAKNVIGIYFSGGLYNTFYHLAVLKYLNENGIVPHVVSGEGSGLFIAAMYAAGKTVDEMEWVFFKLNSMIEKIEDKKDWLNLIAKYVIDSIPNKSIQIFEKTFFINDKKMRKNILSGNIDELLKEYTLDETRAERYSLREMYKEFGVDLVYLSSVVPTSNIIDFDVNIKTNSYDPELNMSKKANLHSIMKELIIEKNKVKDEVKHY
ncbi:MAG: hypothetical protein H6622_03915 [Halobacteriovoraceae bacterium]|nr:hypothetical protein [Halobacteriovoraceae bacterium]